MMKNYIIMFLIITVMLPACSHNDILPTTTPQPSDTAFPTATPTIPPTKTPTPTPIPTSTPDPVRESLKTVIASGYWSKFGLSAEQMTKWQAFAAGSGQLSNGELVILQDFLAQWDKWNGWLTSARIPSYEKLAFRVRQLKGAEARSGLVIYGLDELATRKEGSERIYLPPPPDMAKPKAMILAPRIEGLHQQINAAGDTVEYIDDQGHSLLKGDAFHMWNNTFRKYVESRYTGSNKVAMLFPRFRFYIPGIEAGFFLLDKNLTLQQINFLMETLEIFTTPTFKPLVPYFFTDKKSYVIVEDLETLSGEDYAGLASGGIAILDRESLFENKDNLADAIAHEATHVMQNDWAFCSSEIGDGTIPQEFNDWSADDLIAAIKDKRIGTAHVSLWMHVKLKSSVKDIKFVRETIETKGQYGWDYCAPSGAVPAHVTITNALNEPVEVVFRGPTPKEFTINAGAEYTLDIEPGKYEYSVSARHHRFKPGIIVFTQGINTWRIYSN